MRRGVGVASCWYGCGNTGIPNPSTMKLGITPDGRLVLHQGAVDIGQGSNTVIPQICAEALGMPLEAFEFVGGDTALTPDAGKTSGSRQTYISGKAARNPAARCARRSCATPMFRTLPRFRWKPANWSSARARPCAASRLPICRRMRTASSFPPWKATIRRPGRWTKTARASPMPSMAGARSLSNSRSIPALGTVKLLRITAAHDVGRAINPLLAEGQIEGGIAQGIGMALMEEYVPGRTENLHDYLIPTIGDVPEIHSILVEVPDPEGPFGAKGLGEHVLIPTGPAILNAIRHATGAAITRLPATPDRVLAAIEAARRTGMSELSERFEPADAPEKTAGEKLRCDACPVMCYIAEGRTGACDRYGNFGNRIVRCDPVDHPRAPDRGRRAGRGIREARRRVGRQSRWPARRFVTGIGAGTTYPDYKPAPFIVSQESRASISSPSSPRASSPIAASR
jgi:hypothetical protein